MEVHFVSFRSGKTASLYDFIRRHGRDLLVVDKQHPEGIPVESHPVFGVALGDEDEATT